MWNGREQLDHTANFAGGNMSKSQYLRIKKLIDKIEEEALEEGVDITSFDFQLLIEKLLKQKGFTLAEYQEHEKEPVKEPLELKGVSAIKGDKPTEKEIVSLIKPLIPVVKDGHTPTKEELLELIKPLIPKPKEGKEGKRGERGPRGISAIALRGKRGETGPKGEKGDPAPAISNPLTEKRVLEITHKEQERIIEPMRRLGLGLQSQIDANKITVSEIDLSSQCNGSATTFNLGKKVNYIIFVDLEGTNAPYTLNAAKTQITLTFSPETGETLKAIAI